MLNGPLMMTIRRSKVAALFLTMLAPLAMASGGCASAEPEEVEATEAPLVDPGLCGLAAPQCMATRPEWRLAASLGGTYPYTFPRAGTQPAYQLELLDSGKVTVPGTGGGTVERTGLFTDPWFKSGSGCTVVSACKNGFALLGFRDHSEFDIVEFRPRSMDPRGPADVLFINNDPNVGTCFRNKSFAQDFVAGTHNGEPVHGFVYSCSAHDLLVNLSTGIIATASVLGLATLAAPTIYFTIRSAGAAVGAWFTTTVTNPNTVASTDNALMTSAIRLQQLETEVAPYLNAARPNAGTAATLLQRLNSTVLQATGNNQLLPYLEDLGTTGGGFRVLDAVSKGVLTPQAMVKFQGVVTMAQNLLRDTRFNMASTTYLLQVKVVAETLAVTSQDPDTITLAQTILYWLAHPPVY